jgi:ketol-acid reductoisomerase
MPKKIDKPFYIGAWDKVQRDGWNHKTLDEAVEHAKEMMEKQPDTTEIVIVQAVKIIRRKPTVEVTIEDVAVAEA